MSESNKDYELADKIISHLESQGGAWLTHLSRPVLIGDILEGIQGTHHGERLATFEDGPYPDFEEFLK